MSQSCQPNDLVAQSTPLQSLSEKQQLMVQTYLLAQMAGIAANPGALLGASSAFKCCLKNSFK